MRLSAVALLAALLAASSAQAQLLLPGALGGAAPAPDAPHGGGASSGAAPAAPRPKPAFAKPPSEDSLVGRDLMRAGTQGVMTFGRIGKELAITHLTAQGEEISKPGEQCRIDIDMSDKVPLKPLGHPAGLTRYELGVAACPFSFDVLDGAVLVTPDHPTCDFTAANCRIELGGLWGPAGATFNAERTKTMERERIHTETNMRANFHALLHQAGKDRAAVKKIAGEQAGFSSEREMMCHDYAREAVHGFCALQMTEARAFALQARLAGEEMHAEKKPAKRKPTPKPAPVAMPLEPAQ